MFGRRITDSPFASPEAKVLIPNITVSDINDDTIAFDKSFMSTARALLPFVMQDDVLNIVYMEVRMEENNPSVRDIVDRCNLSNKNDVEHTLKFINLTGDYSENQNKVKAWFSQINGNIAKHKESAGWHFVHKVSDSYKQSGMWVSCLINKELKSSILFGNIEDVRQLHLLQFCFPAYLPWYFENKQKLFKEDRPECYKLIMGLMQKEPDEYVEALSEIAKLYDFRQAKIRRMLAGFEKRIHENDLIRVEQDLDSKDAAFSDLQKRISDLMKERNELIVRYAGLRAILDSDDSENEIMEYFLSNPNIHLENVDDDTLTFVATSYLNYFDNDNAITIHQNRHSTVYSCSSFNYDDTSALIKAIMIDRVLKVRFCAAYRLTLGRQVSGVSNYGYGHEYDSYLPNPHIDVHSCLGNYQYTLNEMVRDGNYIGAIEQCIASVQSLALEDPSARIFFENVARNTGKAFIETPDGQILTAKEAIDWLKAREEKEEGADG